MDKPSAWLTTRSHEAGAGQDLLPDRRQLYRRAGQPAPEAFRKKGVEVLLLTDRVTNG